MATLVSFKVVVPFAILAGALAVMQCCRSRELPPRQLNARQAAMVDSLRSAAPSQEELK